VHNYRHGRRGAQKKPAKWRAKFLLYEASERQNGGRRRIAPPRGLLLASLGRPPIADRLLTRGLRLDLLACQGGPEGDLPSAARVDRAYRRRGGMDDFGARAAAEKI